eukprot:10311156-Alexandrium_andersonii.AAC.1
MAPRAAVAGRPRHVLHSGEACTVRPSQRQPRGPAGPYRRRYGRPDQTVYVARRIRSDRGCRLLGQPRPHTGLH